MISLRLDSKSEILRKRIIKKEEKKVLISSFVDTDQAKDLSVPPNCNGYGRVRHFRLGDDNVWIKDPLPIIPAISKLGLAKTDSIEAQVFQVSACNYRCWYCFVDNENLTGRNSTSKYFTCDELLELYLQQENPPVIIDLSGGQPELVPEWTIWMMEALRNIGLEKKVLLWSDDNLSTDFTLKYLNDEEIQLLESYQFYSKVCCFKGFNKESFSQNTLEHKDLFEIQFGVFERLLKLNIDLYSYITLTSPKDTNFTLDIPKFMDRIQNISENMILRMVPLEISVFSPVRKRMSKKNEELIGGQYKAIEVWKSELHKRFSTKLINTSIDKIPIK
jgi:organic radical activating enzyme